MSFTVSIPVYTEHQYNPGEKPTYAAQPVFFRGFHRDDPVESRALSLLENDLRRHLIDFAQDPQHELPLAWSFSPELKGECVRPIIHLRERKSTIHDR